VCAGWHAITHLCEPFTARRRCVWLLLLLRLLRLSAWGLGTAAASTAAAAAVASVGLLLPRRRPAHCCKASKKQLMQLVCVRDMMIQLIWLVLFL
jgi:hypothetical protein